MEACLQRIRAPSLYCSTKASQLLFEHKQCWVLNNQCQNLQFDI